MLSTKRSTGRQGSLLLLILAMVAGLLAAGATPAAATGAPIIYAPWDSGATYAVGNPPSSGIGGGYYGHCCTGYPSEYYAVDINGPGAGNADCGLNVRATNGGTVSAVGTYSGGITYLRINHGDGYTSEYQHITDPVAVSTAVNRGDIIAKFGNAGTTYCHLHFIVKLNGDSIAPSPMSGVTLPSSNGAYVTSNNSPGGPTGPTPPGPNDPKGNFEALTQVKDGVRLAGWTFDPDSTSTSLAVHIYEGVCCTDPRGAFTANVVRQDVDDRNVGAGVSHGFDITLSIPAGTSGSKTYCAYAINVGSGNNRDLGCKTVTFNWNPIGNYEGIQRAPGGVHLTGWTADLETSSSIDVHVYEGTCCSDPRGAFTANTARPDVGAAFPGTGNGHGFELDIAATPTSSVSKTYCAYAINTGYGSSSPLLGCRAVTVNPDVIGNYESLTAVSGGAQIVGWVADLDTASPLDVHVYEGACCTTFKAVVTANVSRPDVGAALPSVSYGDNHGFNSVIALSPGAHTLCAYGINAGGTTGANLSLGCKTVTVT